MDMKSDRTYWERHARKYDASLRLIFGRPIPRILALASEAVRGKRRVTAAIARTSATIVATDYAAAMIGVLTERVQDLGLDNVTCEQADIYSLPYADGEFGAIVAPNVLHLVPDLPAAISALHRVLAPNGVLVAPTFCHDETRLSRLTSRLLSISRFPGQRRFTARSLREQLEANGVIVTREETLAGLIPIGHIEGTFDR